VKQTGVPVEIRADTKPASSLHLRFRLLATYILCHFCSNVVSTGGISVSQYSIDLLRLVLRELSCLREKRTDRQTDKQLHLYWFLSDYITLLL
jgi:hypothetical protein